MTIIFIATIPTLHTIKSVILICFFRKMCEKGDRDVEAWMRKYRELEDELEGWMNKCKDQEDEMDELVNKAR